MAGNRINRSRPSLSQLWPVGVITALLGLGAALVPAVAQGTRVGIPGPRTVLRAWRC